MRNILNSIFKEQINQYNYKIIGNKLVIVIDEDRRITVYFYNTHSSSSYNSIQFNLTSKTHGVINQSLVKFETIFNSMQDMNHPNKIGKHIWYNDGAYRWYGKPTQCDFHSLQRTLQDYIDIWV